MKNHDNHAITEVVAALIWQGNRFLAEGIPQKLEHCDIRWITVKEIQEYDFCPADQAILDRLRRLRGL